MRFIILILFLICTQVHAGDDSRAECDAQLTLKARKAVNFLHIGYNDQLIDEAAIIAWARNSKWTNPFAGKRNTTGGLGLAKGFQQLSLQMTDLEMASAQREGLRFAEARRLESQVIDRAKTDSAPILVPKIAGPITSDFSNLAPEFIRPAGRFQGRPVFTSRYMGPLPLDLPVKEFLIDPMNPNPKERMVMMDEIRAIDSWKPCHLQTGFFCSGYSVGRTGDIFDMNLKKTTGNLDLRSFGVEELYESFVAKVNGDEKLFATILDNSEYRGFVEIDLSKPKPTIHLIRKGSFHGLHFDRIGDQVYANAYDFLEHKIVIINLNSGKQYEVVEFDPSKFPHNSLVYEAGGKPKLVYARTWKANGYIERPQLAFVDLESKSQEEIDVPGSTSAIFTSDIAGEPHLYYFYEKQLIFRNLLTHRERKFAAGPASNGIYNIAPFTWKGEPYFVWATTGMNLGLLDFNTGDVRIVGESNTIFQGVYPFEYQGRLYALAEPAVGPPHLVRLVNEESK